MEDYIYNYLTENFNVETSQVGNDGIYRLDDKNTHKTPIDGDKLVAEIIAIFGLEVEEVLLFVHIWSCKIKNDIDLDFYWKNNWEVFHNVEFPVVQRVHAKTIASELVAVQPMSAPSDVLYHINTIEPKDTFYIKYKKILEGLQHIY